MKNLLLIYGGHTQGRTEKLRLAVEEGIREFSDEIALRSIPALQADTNDLLWANGLLIGTPEHFGYMSGALKDFMDRTYYPAEGKVDGLPYATFVSAGNDGTGAVSAIERIATGYRWTRIAAPLVVVGAVSESTLAQARELGQTMAAGLAAGIF